MGLNHVAGAAHMARRFGLSDGDIANVLQPFQLAWKDGVVTVADGHP